MATKDMSLRKDICQKPSAGMFGMHGTVIATYGGFMVVILIVAICPQAIFLIVVRVSRNPRYGPDIF